jgi:hypothetical protein
MEIGEKNGIFGGRCFGGVDRVQKGCFRGLVHDVVFGLLDLGTFGCFVLGSLS